MSHFISLQDAIDETTLFRANRTSVVKTEYQSDNILPICETFTKGAFVSVFSRTDVVGVRIYYGMSEDLKVHAIIVGVDSNGADILPENEQEQLIIDRGNRCPDICPATSPLNS